ncbi:FAD-dependent monooxygenase [Plantactinospora siamensis]|uniref:FAD-dependent monooxygenase n=1 Tax=Plantactinospora siamensis TaxID=555372 RepID=A0ABV6NXF9_9ACTN
MSGSAVVVGGGIGGLSAALALRRAGWDVQVFERAPELREVGAGLSLLANGLRGLAALGLGDAVRGGGQRTAPAGLRRPDGRWLSRVDGGDLDRALGTTAVGLHRATLHGILRGALPASALRTGVTVLDVDPAGRVDHSSGGTTGSTRADLIVAADGIRSVVRSRLWPATVPRYSGSTTWRAVIPWPDPLPVAVTWGPGTEFGTVPIGADQMYWYGAFNAPAGERAEDELAAARARFGGWHDPIPALLAATPPAAVLRDDLYYLDPPLPTYVRDRVVLLGDAAHAMTPHLGQGANQAIEDAVVLGAALSREADVPTALIGYDRQRRPRTQEVVAASLRAARVGQQLANPAGVALRNALIRLTPATVALRSMARYADWRPPA